MMQIEKNTVVGLRYILRNEQREVVEDIMDGVPIYYLHGRPGISLRLQQQLEGSQQGDKKELVLVITKGADIEQQTYDVVIDEVRAALPEEIMLGYPVLANNTVCDENCECHNPSINDQSE